MKPLQRFTTDQIITGGLMIAALTLYGFTLAPTVLQADSAEFQFVAWLPAIAHPTGYPLYILLGWLWTHLCLYGEVAWRMNLLSALFATATIGLMYTVAKQLMITTLPNSSPLSQQLAAALATSTFAVSRTFWSQAIIAEVYTLHAFFVVLLLWLALKHRQVSYPLAFVFGLSLTHHVTIVLLLPALISFFTITQKFEQNHPLLKKPNFYPICILCLLAPLTLYFYLPLIAPTTPYQTLILSDPQTLTLYDNTWLGFWQHLTATAFRGELQPTAVGLVRLIMVGQALYQQVGWAGIILAGVGLFAMGVNKRFDLLTLTVLAFLGVVTFNLIYFIGDIFVLFIPAWLFVCLWIGVGSLGLAHWLATKFVKSRLTVNQNFYFRNFEKRLGQNISHFLTISLLSLFFVLPTSLLFSQIAEVSQANNRASSDRWQQILNEPLPQGAILLSNDRDEIMPMWYFQYVMNQRPDLLGLFPLIVQTFDYANIGRLLDQSLASHRAVYLIKPMKELQIKANLTATGTLFLVTPFNPAPTFPHPATLLNSSTSIKLLGYDTKKSSILRGEDFSITLYWQVIQPMLVDYSSYVHLVNKQGQGITQSDHQPGGDFYPSRYWQVGEILRDSHTLTIPVNAPMEDIQLRVGMYYQPKPGQIITLGDGKFIGKITVNP